MSVCDGIYEILNVFLLGVRTGKCVKSDQNVSISVCQIYAWCPVELDVLPMPGHGFKYVT